MQLPLKTRILQYALLKEEDFTVDDIMKGIENEYKGERLFNKKLIEEYFQSFVGIGFFEESRLEFDNNGELITYCKATDYAKDRCKMLM
ncbi:hypothetical protein MCG98_04955 [Ruminococcus sp. OA3]|uniref:hypothetical protein n=1 Tax=Ruminococcus sp. OA3 TaxID=2914164 RepID=UPI001F06791F|nr:hypothetical protein [Ruminococcus sp. OA3]MCH1981918.1 hypothetical protein [Ruminococcus sp. OA3]